MFIKSNLKIVEKIILNLYLFDEDLIVEFWWTGDPGPLKWETLVGVPFPVIANGHRSRLLRQNSYSIITTIVSDISIQWGNLQEFAEITG